MLNVFKYVFPKMVPNVTHTFYMHGKFLFLIVATMSQVFKDGQYY